MGRRPKEKPIDISDIVYLKTDPDKLPRLVVSFKVHPSGMVKWSDTIGEGNEVDYTLEVKKNKKGQDYNLLTVKLVSETQQKPVQTGTPPPPPPPPTNAKMSPEFLLSQKTIIVCEVIRCVFDAYAKDKLNNLEIKGQINELVSEVFSTLDEFKG
jgi:hypothetical protein